MNKSEGYSKSSIEERRKLKNEEVNTFKHYETAIIDSGGVSKSPGIAKFLEKNNLNYVNILDYDEAGKEIMENLKKWLKDKGINKEEANKRLLPISQINHMAETIEDLLPREILREAVNSYLKEEEILIQIKKEELIGKKGEGKKGIVRKIKGMLSKKDISLNFEGRMKFKVIERAMKKISEDNLADENEEIKEKYKHLLKLINSINKKLASQSKVRNIDKNKKN